MASASSSGICTPCNRASSGQCAMSIVFQANRAPMQGRFRNSRLKARNPATFSHGNSPSDISLAYPTPESLDEVSTLSLPQHIDVLGLGQAMIDFGAAVDDSWLSALNVNKGARKLISVEERADILSKLDGESYQVAAGGSLSNTLMALARLGTAVGCTEPDANIKVAMAGLVGNDALGSFYIAQMRNTGVDIVSSPTVEANTGTVVVLSTPDAQRTMLSYLGTPAEIPIDKEIEAAIARSSILVIEGYLWELPNAATTIQAAIAAAKRNGTRVAMTAGDAGVVERHGSELWDVINSAGGIDLLFTNASEAAALVACAPEHVLAASFTSPRPLLAPSSPAEEAALALGPYCAIVCVTDGCNGSFITALGKVHCVPPAWLDNKPVDTCGAGDAYAAGLLFGYIRGYDVVTMGRAAARTASAVIEHHGAGLSFLAAESLVNALPVRGESVLMNEDDNWGRRIVAFDA